MRSFVLLLSTVAALALVGCGSNTSGGTPDGGNLTGAKADPAKSTLSADRSTGITADGADRVTLTVTVRDANGQPLANQLVQLGVSGKSNTVSAPAKTDGNGQTTATLASTVAEQKTVIATLAEGTLTPLTVTFVAGPVDASTSSVSASPGSVVADGTATSTVTVTLKDANGNPVAGQAVTLAASGSQNSLGQPAATDASGVTRGTLASTRAEVKTITASAGATQLDSQPQVTFTAGAASQLSFAVPPSNAKVGAAINPAIQVAVLDAHGNRVDGATSVRLALKNNPTTATISGTLTQTAVAGVATFDNVSVDRAGTGYTLAASASGLPDAVSPAFDVTATGGNKLVFVTQPSTARSQAAISPAVQVAVEDASGKVITTATDAITVALQGGSSGAKLSGTLTVNAVSGVATFSNLSVDKVGTGYALAATGANASGATSGTFDITPGSADQLVFLQQPSNAIAGSAISPAVTVAVEDAAGNVVTSASRTITLNLNPNPTSGTLSGTLQVVTTNGVASFGNLSVDKAGTGYGLHAANSGLTSAYSNLFDVTPGAPNALVFTTQPSAGQNDVPLPSFQVSVEDSLGNVVNTDTRQITLSLDSNPGGATLSGTTTVAAVAGVATFSNVTLDRTGSGYTLRAHASPLSDDLSAPFDITPAPITGAEIDHRIASTGTVDVPFDLSNTVIAAYVPLADGGFDTYSGVGKADGTFSIANVPTTTYLLHYGNYAYYESSTRSWDLQWYAPGRPNLVAPDAGTLLSMDVTGLTSWTDNDVLEIFSENADTWADAIPTFATPPDAGATTWSGAIDLQQVNYAYGDGHLIDATQGDSLYTYQLHQALTPSGITYTAAVASNLNSTLTTANGQTSSMTAAMSAIPQTSSTTTLDFPSFDAQANAIYDGGTVIYQSFYLDQVPVGGHGQYMATPDLVVANLYDAGTPSQAISWNYGLINPAWPQFVQFLSTVQGPRFTLPLPDGGTSYATHGYGSLLYMDALGSAVDGGVHLRISPVRQLTVNGMDAASQSLSGVGTNPVVAWTPPAVGTPTYYRVGVIEVMVSGNQAVKGPRKSVYTRGTSIRLPPGILQSGHSYFLEVSAVINPAKDISSQPFLTGFPVHSADALSQMITP